MSNYTINFVDMTPAEAITLTTKIKTAVQTVEKKHGKSSLTAGVKQTVKELETLANQLDGTTDASWLDKREVDTSSDNINGGLHDSLQQELRIYGASLFPLTASQNQVYERASYLLSELFPEGKAHLSGNREGQYGANQAMLNRIDSNTKLKAEIKAHGLEPWLVLARKTHDEYGKRLGYTTPDSITEYQAWEEVMEQYIGRVIAEYKRSNPVREMLMSPYVETRDSIRLRKKQSSTKAKNEANETKESSKTAQASKSTPSSETATEENNPKQE